MTHALGLSLVLLPVWIFISIVYTVPTLMLASILPAYILRVIMKARPEHRNRMRMRIYVFLVMLFWISIGLFVTIKGFEIGACELLRNSYGSNNCETVDSAWWRAFYFPSGLLHGDTSTINGLIEQSTPPELKKIQALRSQSDVSVAWILAN